MATDRTESLKAELGKSGLRPLLTSLNGDNSWLISFPRPEDERKSVGKAYFHVVHDPWLKGPTTLFSSFIAQLSHAAPAHVKDGPGVEVIVAEIETAAAAIFDTRPPPPTDAAEEKPLVDAIFVNLDQIDHMHEPTLRTFSPHIPVFAASEAAAKISAWRYFDTVVANRDLEPGSGGDWKTLHPGGALPEWLTIFRMRGPHSLSLASAMIWSPTRDTHEALLYSPHGIEINQPTIRTLLDHANPDIRVLAILHGLKESSTWGWLNTFGVSYGLPLYRQSKAKYWVLSHNTPLVYAGLVMKGVKDVERTLEWGLQKEKESGKGDVEREEVNFVQVENGGFTILS